MPKKIPQKRYIIRKYVMATSALEAMMIEKRHKVDDVFIDERYTEPVPVIGFNSKKSNEQRIQS